MLDLIGANATVAHTDHGWWVTYYHPVSDDRLATDGPFASRDDAMLEVARRTGFQGSDT